MIGVKHITLFSHPNAFDFKIPHFTYIFAKRKYVELSRNFSHLRWQFWSVYNWMKALDIYGVIVIIWSLLALLHSFTSLFHFWNYFSFFGLFSNSTNRSIKVTSAARYSIFFFAQSIVAWIKASLFEIEIGFNLAHFSSVPPTLRFF